MLSHETFLFKYNLMESFKFATYNLSKNKPTRLCFHLFAMIQACTCLYSRNYSLSTQVKSLNQSANS